MFGMLFFCDLLGFLGRLLLVIWVCCRYSACVESGYFRLGYCSWIFRFMCDVSVVACYLV